MSSRHSKHIFKIIQAKPLLSASNRNTNQTRIHSRSLKPYATMSIKQNQLGILKNQFLCLEWFAEKLCYCDVLLPRIHLEFLQPIGKAMDFTKLTKSLYRIDTRYLTPTVSGTLSNKPFFFQSKRNPIPDSTSITRADI